MELQQYIQNLKELAGDKAAQLTLSIRVPAANLLLATVKNRIIREGKASDGSPIGKYDKTPMYAGRGVFVNKGGFKPQGKTGKTKFKNGKPHKTMYLPEGYYQLRGIQGRENNIVNLELSGDMLLNYQQAISGTNILQGFTNKKQSDKRRGNELRFKGSINTIFPSSKSELDTYNKECVKGYSELVVNILRG